MAHVVFLRGANVGGKNVFRPAKLVKDLAALDLVNVGAAGTFVVRARSSAQAIRQAILAELPFAPELCVVPAKDLLALVASRPFEGVTFSKDLRGWVAALCGKPKAKPVLPIVRPASGAWSFRFDRLEPGFALGVWQRRPGTNLFPNQVVETALGVPATMRWWETYEKVAALL